MTTSATALYVTSRTVGAATITAIADGSGRSSILGSLTAPREEWRREVDADERDEINLGYNVAHVRLGAASTPIDLGFDDPGPASRWRAPRHRRTSGAVPGLATFGVRPEGITHVLITHAHDDHVAGGAIERAGRWVPRYPNATYILGRADWEGNPERARPDSLLARNLGPVAAAGRLELVDAERAIVPGIAMVAAPGESPGHCLVRVTSAGATLYFLGDLFHHPCEVAHRDWASSGRDQAALVASRDALPAAALPAEAPLMTTHMPSPALGRLREIPTAVIWVGA